MFVVDVAWFRRSATLRHRWRWAHVKIRVHCSTSGNRQQINELGYARVLEGRPGLGVTLGRVAPSGGGFKCEQAASGRPLVDTGLIIEGARSGLAADYLVSPKRAGKSYLRKMPHERSRN